MTERHAGSRRPHKRLTDTRRGMVADAIVYRARWVNRVVEEEIGRLTRELPDVKIFVVCYQPDYKSARHTTPGKVYCYGQRDLETLPYPQKLSGVNWADPTGHH